MTRLYVTNHDLRLRFLSDGQTLPWLGPALKGIVAGTLRQRSCLWSPAEQQGRWQYCNGCPHISTCAYGLTWEPGTGADPSVMPTAGDGQRAIALGPQFPAPEHVQEGDRLRLDLLLTGQAASSAADNVLQAMTATGRRGMLGPDRIRFELSSLPIIDRFMLTSNDLSATPDNGASRIRRLQLATTSPLFLRGQGAERRRHLLQPDFSDLLRGCLRTVGRAFDRFGDGPLEGVDFRGLKEASFAVRTASADWRPFRQGHHSRRSGHRWDFVGVTGSATFSDVPAAFLPWLIWGGRLGVGEHRVCGGGRWEVQAD